MLLRTAHLILFMLTVAISFGQEVAFVPNQGQWNKKVKYRAKINKQTVYFQEDGILFQLINEKDLHNHGPEKQFIRGHNYKVEFLNANTGKFESTKELDYKINFIKNRKPTKSVVPTESFIQKELYKGIDLTYYSSKGKLKYDLIIHPEADLNQVKLEYKGTNAIALKDGNLIIETSIGKVLEQAPYAYQILDDVIRPIKCKYTIEGNIIGYNLIGKYVKSKEVIIDPTLYFSSYSGSTEDNFGYTACFDQDGFLYSGSTAFGFGYPTTLGAFQLTYQDGEVDAVISKFDTTGTNLVYSTYLGGDASEMPHSMVVDNSGDLVIFGTTASTNFPVTEDAFDTTFNDNLPTIDHQYYPNGSDLFIAKLSPDGSTLRASTYFGGTNYDGLNNSDDLQLNYADDFRGAVINNKDDEIIIGSCTVSDNILTTNDGFKRTYGGEQDGILLKFDKSLTRLLYGTYVGGENSDAIYSVQANDSFIVFGGSTNSDAYTFPIQTFPYTAAFDADNTSGLIGRIRQTDMTDAIITKYGSNSETDQVYFVDIDQSHNIYAMGQTEFMNSSFWIDNVGFSRSNSGQFISKFDSNLTTRAWSTLFGNGGGNPNLSPTAFMVDYCDRIYFSGWGGRVNQSFALTSGHPRGNTFNMQVTADAYQSSTDGSDFYIMVLNDDASDLLYASYFGGASSNEHVDGGTSRFDKKGVIYQNVCAGCGGNSDFPIFPANAVSATNNSTNCNNGVFKMSFDFPLLVADFNVDSAICNNRTVYITNNSQYPDGTTITWKMGDGTELNSTDIEHTYGAGSDFEVTLIIENNSVCNVIDSITKKIDFQNSPTVTLDSIRNCGSTVIGPQIIDPFADYSWTPTTGLSNPNIHNPTSSYHGGINYSILKYNGLCPDTMIQYVELDTVTTLNLDFSQNKPDCEATWVEFKGISDPDSNTILTWHTQNAIYVGDSIIHDFDTSGVYNLILSAQYNDICSFTENVSKSILIIKKEDAQSFFDSIITCSNNQEIGLPFTSDHYQFSWTDSSTLSSGSVFNPSSTILEPTVYQLEVKDSNCTDTLYQYVNLTGFMQEYNMVASEASVIPGETVELSIVAENEVNDYIIWNTKDIAYIGKDSVSAESKPLFNKTTFQAQIQSQLGSDCVTDVETTVDVKDWSCEPDSFFIPNAFSPNGDGEHDELIIDSKEATIMEFCIYDRNGWPVYCAINDEYGVVIPWDGNSNNEPVEVGVYVYYYEATCPNGATFKKKGNITLIR